MASKNMQLFLFSAALLATGVAHSSPVLYAWGGHSDGSDGGRTYAIDPVAATVVVVRGPGAGSGGSGLGGASGAIGGGSGIGAGGGSPGVGGSGSPSFSNFSTAGAGGTASPSGSSFNAPADCGSVERLRTLAEMLGLSTTLSPTGTLPPCDETLRSTLLELVSTDGTEGTASDVIIDADTFIFADGLLPVAEGEAFTSSLAVTAVPEPAGLGLFGLALVALGARMRRRKQ